MRVSGSPGDVLGATPAGNGVIVLGAAGQRGKVAVNRLRKLDSLLIAGSPRSFRCRHCRVHGPRATLGPVLDTALETSIVDGANSVDEREFRVATRALEQIALTIIIWLTTILGLFDISCGCDDWDRSRRSVSLNPTSKN